MRQNSFDAGVYLRDLLNSAAARGASDLYFLPGPKEFVIQERRLGRQSETARLASGDGELCVGKLKVWAKLLSYRTRVAQDGAIRDSELFGATEFRVSSMPVLRGERITVRILDRSRRDWRLDELGFDDGVRNGLLRLLSAPSGMMILTGPTGSGKTTTMYAMVRELLARRDDPASIIAVEDPVEGEIPEISQLDLAAPGCEMSLADALKAALRQDVKTLVIGEMRDAESVRVALEAAFTGHRVIASFHAGDAPMVYARLLQQGFEPFLLAGAVVGVVAQRLLPSPEGDGMIPVAAVLEVDDAWRELILRRPTLRQLRDAEAERGCSLPVGLNSVRSGVFGKTLRKRPFLMTELLVGLTAGMLVFGTLLSLYYAIEKRSGTLRDRALATVILRNTVERAARRQSFTVPDVKTLLDEELQASSLRAIPEVKSRPGGIAVRLVSPRNSSECLGEAEL